MMRKAIKLDDADNVAVICEDVKKGDEIEMEGSLILIALDDIPRAHKIAIADIPAGTNVKKYGSPIGRALLDIPGGAWVHSHNLQTGLIGKEAYEYKPVERETGKTAFQMPPLYMYRRKNGSMGIRNELWIVPTVGCVNGIAGAIVNEFLSRGKRDGIDGVYAFSHPYGCSQLGEDHHRTRGMLQNIAVHPNAGGVLVLGLGCENNQIETFKATMPEGWDRERIIFLEAQSAKDEIKESVAVLEDLYQKAASDKRVPGTLSDLNIGLECGGSDAFSGITANPLLGRLADYVISGGGSAVLTEVPEMFGAEHILMEQCDSEETFNKTADMINEFKDYFSGQGQPVYENPSPGNKEGGITTLEEKSLGCTRKAGNSKVVDVLEIDQIIEKKGLILLKSPGNDLVATTALGAAGCQLVLFSTGRGNPLCGFIPTVKIASNSELAGRKPHWIDFDAGRIMDRDGSPEDPLRQLLNVTASIANGEKAKAERLPGRDIAIFKTGVTL